MATSTITLNLGAGETRRAVGRGKIFVIQQSSAAVHVRSVGRAGYPVALDGVGAGLKFGPVPDGQEWDYLDIFSATAQAVTLVVSDDPVEFASAVSVTGVALVQVAPSSSFSVAADVSLAAAGTHSIAANASRRRLTVASLSSNFGSVRIAQTGVAGAARGIELQPGLAIELQTVSGIDIYNGGSGAATLMIAEEA